MMAYTVEIDEGSGFCFGVVNAIKKAEEVLDEEGALYCLGDIVHNGKELKRLEDRGLETIDYQDYTNLKNSKVLLRAHGEPPSSYLTAKDNNIQLVDATCPVVLRLQKRVREGYQLCKQDGGQVVIYGKKHHAEVNGLVGQTDGTAIVVENEDDIASLDLDRPIRLYSQTTKMEDQFKALGEKIKALSKNADTVFINNTICKEVSKRIPGIKKFARGKDVILFVSGRKSSNGRVLFEECRKENKNSYFITGAPEITAEWIKSAEKIGICGATSTPKWLMERVVDAVHQIKQH